MNVVGRALTRSAGVRRLIHRPPILHTQAPKSLARFATSPSGSRSLNELFETLQSSKDLNTIRNVCSALVVEAKNPRHADAPKAPSSIDTDKIAEILCQLVLSGQQNDWNGLEGILRDVYPMLGLNPSGDAYTSVLCRLAAGGHLDQVQSLLLKMPELPGNITPDINQFHQVLKSCINAADSKFLQDFPITMQKLGQQPTTDTFKLLFRAHWNLCVREKGTPTVDDISSLIQSYRGQGLLFEPTIVHALFQNYADVGQFQQAEDIASQYEAIFKESTSEPTETNLISKAEDDVRLSEGPSRLDDAAISKLRNATSYAQLKEIERSTAIRFTLRHYTIAMNNICRISDKNGAVHLYEKSKEAGLIPDAKFVAPLIRVLGVDGSDASIDRVLDILRHLVDSNPSPAPDGTIRGPDAGTYKSVLQALSVSRNYAKYGPVMQSLLEEIRSRKVSIEPSILAEYSIILEMRRKGNFSDAIEVYREYRNELSERSFFNILREYCRISFSGDLEVPLITQFFSIVNDMRLQRIPITTQVYGIILHHIGYLATKVGKMDPQSPRTSAMYDRLVSTVRRVHDFLTLDASISPDTFLWNQLMDAYQRLGCFGDACRLWDMMYLTNRFDQISVTIILDACGYAKHTVKAATILRKLERKGFKIDLRNWNTWVECLCRARKFREAVDVVCIEMPKNNVDPNIESIRILEKFAKRNNISGEYLRRIERTLPTLWKKLPNEMRESW
ncbi:hypothetical protein D9613_002227 [Agrocybe pediades]|uniref:Pentatricopeptide repeat-containing protein n=1 Tax=Agrocybe pediades TaxID=84607 RepID=A0A8H4VXB4_9AGAR|nr:hypothetical protein D9613_002227 [Agrocybe pediades]